MAGSMQGQNPVPSNSSQEMVDMHAYGFNQKDHGQNVGMLYDQNEGDAFVSGSKGRDIQRGHFQSKLNS